MEFPRQEYWSGLPFLSLEDLPDSGVKLRPLHCRWILYHWATWEVLSQARGIIFVVSVQKWYYMKRQSLLQKNVGEKVLYSELIKTVIFPDLWCLWNLSVFSNVLFIINISHYSHFHTKFGFLIWYSFHSREFHIAKSSGSTKFVSIPTQDILKRTGLGVRRKRRTEQRRSWKSAHLTVPASASRPSGKLQVLSTDVVLQLALYGHD